MVREKLDVIAKDHVEFGLNDLYKSVPNRREETCSYVYEKGVIGRDTDKEAIVGMLLSDSHSSNQNVSFVTIVGMGGLGKTTLAQFVYHDHRIQEEFSMRSWVCVSEEFGIKDILSKMLGKDVFNLENLQREVRELIEGRRYLLVLDDVWNESSNEWDTLRSYLAIGARGSKIVVTSRSKKVAIAIGNDPMYELQGLSENDSWHLFKMIALGQGEDQADTDLVMIGKDVVKKCANVPLSIRLVSSLLRNQNKSKWLSFESNNFTKISQGDSIMPILMFSYYHLTPELKSCFSYCALFPKGYVIEREVLVSLWLAQGFLIPPQEGQSMEDIGEHYFSILLHRCFFQDIQLDEFGEVLSCKMHDLIHDLAQEVAGKESITLRGRTSHLGRKIRHLSIIGGAFCQNWCNPSEMKVVRTFLRLSNIRCNEVATIISNCRRLRALDLRTFIASTLPNTLGKLLHLRYLDLSHQKTLELLPESITKLHNLQILMLCGCENLKELPEDTSKLVNLRTLDIDGCDKLTHMPAGMAILKCLHKLTVFVVGGADTKQVKKGQLIDLKALVNLIGHLCIKVGTFSSNHMPNATDGAYILRDAHLKVLEVICEFPRGQYVEQFQYDQGHFHETLLEGLYPNCDLIRVVMSGYQGSKLPSWTSLMGTSLPGLVSIELSDFIGLHHLPSLSRLCHLKYLKLSNIPNLEYIESDAPSISAAKAVECMTFFPSLEELELQDLPKLKGWWRGISWMEMEAGGGACLVNDNGSMEQALVLPLFSHLHVLRIICCSSMTYFPPCPRLKLLDLRGINEALTFCMKGGVLSNTVVGTTAAASSPILFCLEELSIDNAGVFNSLFREFVLGSVRIEINFYDQVISLRTVREGFQRCASSLRLLSIYNCQNLKSLSGGGIEHLSNLQSLCIDECFDLDLEEAGTEEGMPWKNLHFLSSLTLNGLPRLVNLPKGLQYLTSLQSLQISRCAKLEALGECVSFLTSLQSLHIEECYNLKVLPECLNSLTSLHLLHINR